MVPHLKVDTKYLILEVDKNPEVEPRGANHRVTRVRRGKQDRKPGKPKRAITGACGGEGA